MVANTIRNYAVGNDGGSVFHHYYCDFDAESVIREFAVPDPCAHDDYFVNFLGVKVAPSVFPSFLSDKTGTVEDPPLPANWHSDIAEWASCLLTVKRAKKKYVIIEVGCGWGCWLANMGIAAKQIGLSPQLIGIEADPYHLRSAQMTMAINGLSDRSQLIHGVAAPERGHALFPITKNGEDWGGEPILFPSTYTRMKRCLTHRPIQCYPLHHLSDNSSIDLLHIDIQGGEYNFCEGNWPQIDKYVKHVFVGTHSRILDGKLVELFQRAGWKIEMERPTISDVVDGQFITRVDGVQLWKNPRF